MLIPLFLFGIARVLPETSHKVVQEVSVRKQTELRTETKQLIFWIRLHP